MRKVLFMAVSALLICTSCVTKKKYLEAENGRLEAIGRGNALQEQLVDCKDAGDKLNERPPARHGKDGQQHPQLSDDAEFEHDTTGKVKLPPQPEDGRIERAGTDN